MSERFDLRSVLTEGTGLRPDQVDIAGVWRAVDANPAFAYTHALSSRDALRARFTPDGEVRATYEEIATAYHVSRTWVGYQLQRGLRLLRHPRLRQFWQRP